mmetsp:Transcript_27488/g.98115  ORF Transcript_27488/g.98115 Transcript_27488/m.98115 type:complete len:307 (-) Transcript_27488:33-953(-)
MGGEGDGTEGRRAPGHGAESRYLRKHDQQNGRHKRAKAAFRLFHRRRTLRSQLGQSESRDGAESGGDGHGARQNLRRQRRLGRAARATAKARHGQVVADDVGRPRRGEGLERADGVLCAQEGCGEDVCDEDEGQAHGADAHVRRRAAHHLRRLRAAADHDVERWNGRKPQHHRRAGAAYGRELDASPYDVDPVLVRGRRCVEVRRRDVEEREEEAGAITEGRRRAERRDLKDARRRRAGGEADGGRVYQRQQWAGDPERQRRHGKLLELAVRRHFRLLRRPRRRARRGALEPRRQADPRDRRRAPL